MSQLRTEAGDFRCSPDGLRLYQCDNCSKVEAWGESWAWYGSYRQMEDFGLKGVEPIMTICSGVCRIALIAAGRLPDEGLNDVGEVIEDNSDDAPPRRSRR